ncbi:hypothetical protein DPMN_041639 [Dreissena polymorpha]|uniref:Uncharacterized protein n=1 Tax=Dreissena polymorpha TaxID=45954 RepID=A0A9D4CZ61_DREPO|nr:hypothetical protein DPMN_041639 [Dreissena polymorpha]
MLFLSKLPILATHGVQARKKLRLLEDITCIRMSINDRVAKACMEWRAFIAACFYRKKVIGSTEFEDILGLIRVNFNQVRCTIRDNDGVICIQQDQKLKTRYCSIWVDKFNPNGSIYMQVVQ